MRGDGDMALTTGDVHRLRRTTLVDRLRKRRSIELVAGEILATAGTAQLPDGRTFTGVPIEFAVELVLHLKREHEGQIFVAVEERLLRRLAVEMGNDAWAPGAISNALVTAEELRDWITLTGIARKTLAMWLGVHYASISHWLNGKEAMPRKHQQAIREWIDDPARWPVDGQARAGCATEGRERPGETTE